MKWKMRSFATWLKRRSARWCRPRLTSLGLKVIVIYKTKARRSPIMISQPVTVATRGHGGSVIAIQPPPWPWWPITLATALVAAMVYLYVRAARNGRSVGERVGIVVVALVLFAIPALTVIVTQGISCRDSAVLSRSSASLGLTGATVVVLLVALGLLGLAAGEPLGTTWRMPAVLLLLLVPASIVEALVSIVTLDAYCEGTRGPLQLHAGLALVLPVLLGLGLAWHWRGADQL